MIKKFYTYIKENHEDLDPYGEENWNYGIEIHDGDIVICVDDTGIENSSNKNKIKLGVDYEVLDIINNHVSLKGISGWWMMERFKKDTRINENHEDLDPYGEEVWGDPLDINFKIGDKVECIENDNSQLEFGRSYTVSHVIHKNIIALGFIYLEDAPDPYLAYRMNRFKKL